VDPPDRPRPRPAPRLATAAAQHQQPTPPLAIHSTCLHPTLQFAGGSPHQPHFRHQVEPKPKLWIIRLSNAEGDATLAGGHQRRQQYCPSRSPQPVPTTTMRRGEHHPRSWSPAADPCAVPRSRAADSRWTEGRARTEPDHSGRSVRMVNRSRIAGPLPAVPVTFLSRVHRVRVPAIRGRMTSGRSWWRAYVMSDTPSS
jgi:hypothetical protein